MKFDWSLGPLERISKSHRVLVVSIKKPIQDVQCFRVILHAILYNILIFVQTIIGECERTDVCALDADSQDPVFNVQ